jgi:hypothetical protein
MARGSKALRHCPPVLPDFGKVAYGDLGDGSE